MNKKRLLQSIFVVLSVLLFITALSYASTMLFFKLYHIDLSLARPFAIWQYWQAYHAVPEKKLRLIVNSCAFGPYVILAVLTMILLLNKKRRSLHGDARFATLKEIKEAGLIEPKSLDKTILVGKYKKHYLTTAAISL